MEYVPAIDNLEIGCLSANMINSDGEELIEGGKYLQAFENKFNPDVKATRRLYSFQLIEETFESFKLGSYIEQIIEIIIFDSLIGNGDRHQENWAFINQITPITSGLDEMEKDVKQGKFEKLPGFLRWFFKSWIDSNKQEFKPEIKVARLFLQRTKDFAPIYDNGSSLGRELAEERMQRMLSNENEMTSYLDRGVSEIHWEQEKMNHFDLIVKLHDSDYNEIVGKIIERVIEKFDLLEVKRIVELVDNAVPINFQQYRLSGARKQLIYKMVTLRFERLKKLHSERV